MTSDLTLDAAQGAAPRRRSFSIGDGGAVAGLEFGDPARAIDVVFLHANGFNAMTYRSILAPLGARMRLLAVDLQGHGLSPQREQAEGRLDWLDFRDDLTGLLDLLDGPPVVLSGHSMGGTIAVLAAAERPRRVRGLALFDPVMLHRKRINPTPLAESPLASGALRRRSVFPDRSAAIDSYRGRGAFKTWSEATLADYAADGFRGRADGQVELTCAPEWEASNFRAHGHDAWAALARIGVPTAILRAEFGSTCQILTAEPFAAANPRLTVETIDGASHFLPMERPELVRRLLEDMALAPPPAA
jgi:pimeloyl-ACP methyl ester carboxylesterase